MIINDLIAVRKQLATGQTYHPNASPRIHSELSPRQPNPTESLPNYAIPRSPTLKGKQGYLVGIYPKHKSVSPFQFSHSLESLMLQGDHSSENYRDELKRQIEEKKQREKKTKEKERLEDERLFQKIQEENERMQRDFDEETNKQKQREEEVSRFLECNHFL